MKVRYETYRSIHIGLGVLSSLYAMYTLYIFATIKPIEFQHYMHIAVWAIVPPVWFFLEYAAIDFDFVTPKDCFSVDKNSIEYKAIKSELLESTKTYADLASKIWAAILFILVVA